MLFYFVSALLACAGLLYMWVGACMLFPVLAGLSPGAVLCYASAFKSLATHKPPEPDDLEDDPQPPPQSQSPGKTHPERLQDFEFRFLAYWLFTLGLLRFLLSFASLCLLGYLTMLTFILEAALVLVELLSHDNVQLHNGMIIVVQAVLTLFVCMAGKLPACVA